MTRNWKKIMLLVISIIMVSAVTANAGNPIPSFNFRLKHNANFKEALPVSGHSTLSIERRDMNVSNDTPGRFDEDGLPSGNISVLIYRLDHSVTLGPFIVPAGETLTVPIDGNPWGVFVHSNHHTIVSVWATPEL